MRTKNTKNYQNERFSSYIGWKKRLLDVVSDEDPVKDHLIYYVNVFENTYQKNHGKEPVERNYSNGRKYLLDSLFSQDLHDRENFVPIMITLQKMAYLEFKKSK